MGKINIQLVDDHPVIHMAIPHVLEGTGYALTHFATSGKEAMEQFQPDAFQGIILDLYMHPEPGERVLEFHRQHQTGVPILIYTGSTESARLRRCLDLGAKGCVYKLSPVGTFLEAMESVFVKNAVYLDPSLGKISGTASALTKTSNLSRRETEVAIAISNSKTSREISQELKISENTVNIYRARLMKKLQVNDSVGVTRCVIAAGLLSVC